MHIAFPTSYVNAETMATTPKLAQQSHLCQVGCAAWQLQRAKGKSGVKCMRLSLAFVLAGPGGPSPDPPTAPPVSRHWSHQLTQVFKAAAASLPGRTGHLPMSDGKLPVVASQQPLAPELAISTATDETVAEAPQLASNTDQLQDPQHSPVQLPQCSRADVLTAVAQPPSQQERRSDPAPIIMPQATGPHHGHLWPSDPVQSSAPAQLVDSHHSAPPDLTSITAPQLPQMSVRAPMPDSAVAVSKQGDRLAAADTGGASPGPPSVPPPKHQTGASLAPTSIPPITHQSNVTLAPEASALVKTETQGQCQLDSPELPAFAPQSVPPSDDLQPVQPQEPVTAYRKAMPDSQAAPTSSSIPAQAVAQALQTKTIHLPRRCSPVSAPHSSALHAQQAVTPNQETLKAEVKQTELDLAPQVVAASLAVPTVLAECLASNRIKRVPGGDPLEVHHLPCPPCYMSLLANLHQNHHFLQSRVLLMNSPKNTSHPTPLPLSPAHEPPAQNKSLCRGNAGELTRLLLFTTPVSHADDPTSSA